MLEANKVKYSWREGLRRQVQEASMRGHTYIQYYACSPMWKLIIKHRKEIENLGYKICEPKGFHLPTLEWELE